MSQPQAVTALDAPGFVLRSTAQDIWRWVESEKWLEKGVELGVERVSWALDGISLRLDPFGTFGAWAFARGVKWLVDYVQPVQDLMNQVIGDPERVGQFADGWGARVEELQRQEAKVEDARERARRNWPEGDASRDNALHHLEEHVVLLGAGRIAASAVEKAARGARAVVVAAHSLIIDLVGQLLFTLARHVPVWLAKAGASMGTATVLVAAEVTALVAQCVRKIVAFVKLVISSLGNLGGYIKELRKVFTGIRNAAPKMDDVKLLEEDLQALSKYTTVHHSLINRMLRGDPLAGIHPVVVTELNERADTISAALAKLPPHAGTSYRGADLSDFSLATYVQGEVITERAFMSTSARADGALPGNTYFIVSGHSGRDVAPYSAALHESHESEVLFDRGTQFLVTSKKWNPELGRWVILLKEVRR